MSVLCSRLQGMMHEHASIKHRFCTVTYMRWCRALMAQLEEGFNFSCAKQVRRAAGNLSVVI